MREFRPGPDELNEKAREALLVELFRGREITHRQLGEALGLGRYETDGLLKRCGVGLDVSAEKIRQGCGLLGQARPS
ncbi:MAG: hypothetical protein BGO49_28130 [Planctomycetales bacterium 71-10]|nr:MAG: hypothetical protein BGO49_28130 [Planctomycetales bacterium 71-10]